MNNEQPRPGKCGRCDSEQVQPHCDNPQCPWSKCACLAVTGYVQGKLHVAGAPW